MLQPTLSVPASQGELLTWEIIALFAHMPHRSLSRALEGFRSKHSTRVTWRQVPDALEVGITLAKPGWQGGA